MELVTIMIIGSPESEETQAIRKELEKPVSFDEYKRLMCLLENSF